MKSAKNLTQSELSEFYASLEKKLNALRRTEAQTEMMEEHDVSSEAFDEAAPTKYHQADGASQAEEQEMVSRLAGRNIREIEEVEAALVRIETGKFGKCENCHKGISILRLKEIPEARFCQTCEADVEKTQRLASHQPFQNRRDFKQR